MSLWQLLAVATVQGLTEFLPVSSSAHLILLPKVLGMADQGLRFDIAAHLGTFLSVLVYFRHDLRRLLASLSPAEGASAEAVDRDRKLLGLVLVASVPVLIAGAWFREDVATAARSARVVALASIGFGVLLWLADRYGSEATQTQDLGRRGAIFVGVAQALALIPGASRSGTTISAGRFLGLRREEAARFSFLLSIPVSVGIGVAEVLDLRQTAPGLTELWQLAAVVMMAAVAGYLCIHLFLGYVRRHSMTPFVVYRLLLGVAVWVLA